MKLELKHLAPYFPYGLQIDISNYKCDYVGIKRATANGYYFIGDELHITYSGGHTGKDVGIFKPILRPMSDFDKIKNTIDLDTDFVNPYVDWSGELICINTGGSTYLSDMLSVNDFLFENQFDVFGLIPAGLAIDINTLKDEPTAP